jgi:hypothetical protein
MIETMLHILSKDSGEKPARKAKGSDGRERARNRFSWNESPSGGLNPHPFVEFTVSWDRPFDQPVPLPNAAPARTLRDAADYIKKLPKSVHDRDEWRLAGQMLIDAAENRGPTLFARMGILRATEKMAHAHEGRR